MKNLATISLVNICAGLKAGYCQAFGTLHFDASNMRVSVKMNRETYLPGEVAQVKLTVSNPAGTPVVSLIPFLPSTGCLSYLMKEGADFKVVREVCGSEEPISSATTMTFAPVETKQITLNSYDQLLGIGPSVFLHSVGTRPGTYAVSFRFGGSAEGQAEYTVEPAKLEADAVARVRDLMFSDNPGVTPPRPIATYVHALALRSAGASYICVSQRVVAHKDQVTSKVDFRDNVDFDNQHVEVVLVAPFKRVAMSSAPVVSLSATADADENLTIEWTDWNGTKGQFSYSASYPASPRKQRQ